MLYTNQDGVVGYYPGTEINSVDRHILEEQGSILMIIDNQPTWVSHEEAFGEVSEYVTKMASEMETLKAELLKLKAEIEVLKEN